MSTIDFFMIGFFFIIGLVIGSFLNVCIYRIPRDESIVFPPSHCAKCDRRIGSRDLFPLFSYLWLKGRCRHCGQRISPVYPLVESLTGLLFVSIYLHFGFSLLTAKFLVLGAVLLVVSLIDLEHYIIPNRVLLFALVAGVFLNLLARDLTVVSILSGFLAASGLLLLPAIISRGGMGGGDIKLAAVIGFYLGWPQGLLAVFLGCLLAGLTGLLLVLVRIKGRKDAIPFGPFLAAGALLALFRGKEILSWYLATL